MFTGLAFLVEIPLWKHHTRSMTGLHVDQRVIATMLRRRMPRLWAHLQDLRVSIPLVTTKVSGGGWEGGGRPRGT